MQLAMQQQRLARQSIAGATGDMKTGHCGVARQSIAGAAGDMKTGHCGVSSCGEVYEQFYGVGRTY